MRTMLTETMCLLADTYVLSMGGCSYQPAPAARQHRPVCPWVERKQRSCDSVGHHHIQAVCRPPERNDMNTPSGGERCAAVYQNMCRCAEGPGTY